MTQRVLLVDDDDRVLNALKRRLYRKFKVDTINNAPGALELIEKERDYAVVISDQQMPEMDGITFLKQLAARHPHMVRIMLTGNLDQHTAVSSINDGKVFRYLNKPCSMEDLSQAIQDGLEMHRIETAERKLLEQTLAGSVKLLTDILSVNDPDTFRQVSLMRKAVKQLAGFIGHPRYWELDLTVMLSAIGEVVLPPELRSRIASGEELSPVEKTILADTPKTARDLLMNIPRLKGVAAAIYYQNKAYDGSGYPNDNIKGENIPQNARILYLLKHLLEASGGKPPSREDFDKVELLSEKFDPALLETTKSFFLEHDFLNYVAGANGNVMSVSVEELLPGDKLLEALLTEKGQLALKADSVLTDALIQQTLQFHRMRTLREPVRILRPHTLQ